MRKVVECRPAAIKCVSRKEGGERAMTLRREVGWQRVVDVRGEGRNLKGEEMPRGGGVLL